MVRSRVTFFYRLVWLFSCVRFVCLNLVEVGRRVGGFRGRLEWDIFVGFLFLFGGGGNGYYKISRF